MTPTIERMSELAKMPLLSLGCSSCKVWLQSTLWTFPHPAYFHNAKRNLGISGAHVLHVLAIGE
jgi:hypothetical protein